MVMSLIGLALSQTESQAAQGVLVQYFTVSPDGNKLTVKQGRNYAQIDIGEFYTVRKSCGMQYTPAQLINLKMNAKNPRNLVLYHTPNGGYYVFFLGENRPIQDWLVASGYGVYTGKEARLAYLQRAAIKYNVGYWACH